MPWLQVSVAATDSNYQRVEDALLMLGAQSITFRDAADNPILEPQPGETPLWKDAIITGLFDDQQAKESLREQLQRQLEYDRLDISISILADQDWTRAWTTRCRISTCAPSMKTASPRCASGHPS